MQNKGLIRLVAILFAIACIWQLSFTAVTRLQEKKAAKYAEAKAQQFVASENINPEYVELIQYLKERQLYINEPVSVEEEI